MSTFWINSINSDEYKKISSQKRYQTFEISNKNKISRMKKGDKIIYFINDKDVFTGISEIKSDSFEELNNELISIKIKKGIHIKIINSIDANQIGPSLEYVKRWAPEKWKLALFGNLHIISQGDYNLIESCILKINNLNLNKFK